MDDINREHIWMVYDCFTNMTILSLFTEHHYFPMPGSTRETRRSPDDQPLVPGSVATLGFVRPSVAGSDDDLQPWAQPRRVSCGAGG